MTDRKDRQRAQTNSCCTNNNKKKTAANVDEKSKPDKFHLQDK